MDVCLFAAGDDDALKNQKNAGRMNFMRPASVCQKTPQKRLEIWYNREKSEVRKWKCGYWELVRPGLSGR